MWGRVKRTDRWFRRVENFVTIWPTINLLRTLFDKVNLVS